jgi:hypothetical protein
VYACSLSLADATISSVFHFPWTKSWLC